MLKALSVMKKIISSVILIVCLIAVAQISYFLSIPETKEITTYDGFRHIIVSLTVSCLFLYMLVRFQMIYNTPLRQKYQPPLSIGRRIKFIFTSFDFLIDCVCFALTFILFDFRRIFAVLSELLKDSGDEIKIWTLALPIIIFIDFLARYLAIGCWFQTKSEFVQSPDLGNDPMAKNSAKLVPTAPELHAMRFLSRTYSINATVEPIIERSEDCKKDESEFTLKSKVKSVLLIVIPTFLMIVSCKFLYSTLKIMGWFICRLAVKWQTWAIILAFIIAIFAFRRIKALVQRYRFTARLKKVCKANKYRLSKIKKPYRSLFSLFGGENFTVTVNGKSYSCKFVSCTKSSTPLILDKNGEATFVNGITFAGVNWFQSTKKFEYTFDSDFKKILIINPSMKFTYAVNDGLVSELDNGDRIGEYMIFTGNSFINAIDRDCVEKNG